MVEAVLPNPETPLISPETQRRLPKIALSTHDNLGLMRHPDDFLGIAGPALSDHDRAVLKQAVFLLRYRARLGEVSGVAVATD